MKTKPANPESHKDTMILDRYDFDPSSEREPIDWKQPARSGFDEEQRPDWLREHGAWIKQQAKQPIRVPKPEAWSDLLLAVVCFAMAGVSLLALVAIMLGVM